ncbi:uncharacterized protein TRAVEDRAFT_27511 [Trametes versicolor FP-101664 SS1]|uniref:uncharacterized protein n=1 Tax=Trametes versicolor (strain FP-101664) TaxID=717944 RepID=UPI000462158A|nr:uncharacterized protein TRAVEDRAFT_27511 [Trametes versicolor FP-101664 SS1]EIW62153.1 hypothetical protein TRAVEDRAFT_27511 [Trametes versicolor FP-101664 SS1]
MRVEIALAAPAVPLTGTRPLTDPRRLSHRNNGVGMREMSTAPPGRADRASGRLRAKTRRTRAAALVSASAPGPRLFGTCLSA